VRALVEMIAIAWTMKAAYDVLSFAGGFVEGFCQGLRSSLRKPISGPRARRQGEGRSVIFALES
jgi:hypothetical protein